MTRTSSSAPLEVWKFGGASLADAAAIHRAASLIASHSGPLVIVASALAGITDLLLGGAQRAAAGAVHESAANAATILQRHRQAVKAREAGCDRASDKSAGTNAAPAAAGDCGSPATSARSPGPP